MYGILVNHIYAFPSTASVILGGLSQPASEDLWKRWKGK